MTIQDLGSLGELIAAIATVLTLIYLAISIRHNSKTVAASAKQELGQTLVEFNSQIFSDEDSTRIWNLGRKSLENLTELERARYSGFLIMGLSTTENAYYQSKDGYLDQQYLDRNNRILAWWGSQPGIIEMWPEIREFLTEEFQQVFDSFIQRQPADIDHEM